MRRRLVSFVASGMAALFLAVSAWTVWAQAVPMNGGGGGGGTGGSGTAGQCALWSGATTLTGDPGCAYTGTDTTFALAIGGSVSGPLANFTSVVGGNVTDSALTATRVVFAGTAGLLASDADMTFATDTLTATKVNSTLFTAATTSGFSNFLGTSSLSTGGSTMELRNDQGANAYFFARNYGSTNAQSLFGQTLANFTILITDGSSSAGMIVGTVSADPLILGTNSTANLTLASGGAATFTNTVTSSRATDLGWSVVAGANTACNTTCTNACVVGQDTGTANIFVGCTDATADVCLCAGAN